MIFGSIAAVSAFKPVPVHSVSTRPTRQEHTAVTVATTDERRIGRVSAAELQELATDAWLALVFENEGIASSSVEFKRCEELSHAAWTAENLENGIEELSF